VAVLATNNTLDHFDEKDDLFSTAMPELLIVFALIPFLALGLALVFLYWGVEHSMPPWNSHSVPPPRMF
jgi:hypothetical protein